MFADMFIDPDVDTMDDYDGGHLSRFTSPVDPRTTDVHVNLLDCAGNRGLGFDIAMTPYFSVSNLQWMEMGGVFAMPNLRGGSEYGKEWHEGGMKLKKQTVFDDFIAAAQWLISEFSSRTKIRGVTPNPSLQRTTPW